jgi:hypothetical protein
MRPRLSLVLACATALGLSGCAGYRLGPSSGEAAGTKSIQVNAFLNQTLEPHLGEAVTAALRKCLQRDGTYRLATQGESDIVVTGELTRYDRSELSYRPSDILTVLDYRVTLSAHVTARERTSGKTILDKDVSGYTLMRVGSDMASAERQALPLLAEDLAKHITGLLVDGSW